MSNENIVELNVAGRAYRAVSLPRAAARGLPGIATLPFCLRVLVENMLRNPGDEGARAEDVARLVAREPGSFAFRPARVLLQDLLGIPLLVDFAAMRDAAARDGLDPALINPAIPADLIIDHSLKVAHWGSADARARNEAETFRENLERFRFLRWARQAFTNLRVFPPDSGIMHQVNLEYLAKVVWVDGGDGGVPLLYPDTLVGTDSHTPMVNGLGVVGWGVGGLEAEAAMLGEALIYSNPQVLGVRLHGTLGAGVTATDLVLTVTQTLRALGVVGKFVEFFGAGLDALGVADRGTIANMAPEYGATCVFFPVDRRTVDYLRFTGRDPEHLALVEGYCRAQGLWRDAATPAPQFDQVLDFDLTAVRPCLAGPALVVAYALAGTLTLDLTREPLGHGPDGTPVFLADLWPADDEIRTTVAASLSPAMFRRRHDDILEGSDDWRALDAGDSLRYPWQERSTYIRRPPFFDAEARDAGRPGLAGLRPLVILGDSITTDHISPSGAISPDSDAGRYLLERGTDEAGFNSYGTRRGNFEVVARATFANRRLRNAMLPGHVGSVTRVMPQSEVTTVYQAARAYARRGEGLLVVAGSEYGCGSSRDTAAKGPWLIGVRAVLARSFERIHRSNLVGMGILPLEFADGASAQSLGLTGGETFDVLDVDQALAPRMIARVRIHPPRGEPAEISVTVRLDTPGEVESYRCGGILPRIYARQGGGRGPGAV